MPVVSVTIWYKGLWHFLAPTDSHLPHGKWSGALAVRRDGCLRGHGGFWCRKGPGIQGMVLMQTWTGNGCTEQLGGEGAGCSCG